MARVTGFATQITGSIKGMEFYQLNGQTILRQKPAKPADYKMSFRQLHQCVKMSNLVNLYKATNGTLLKAFEFTKPHQHTENMFVGSNLTASKIFLTKAEAKAGTMILDNYLISNGTMDKGIRVEKQGQRMVSSISCGDLVIDANTSVSEFSAAVIANNHRQFMVGDKIIFYRATQVAAGGGQPACVDFDSQYVVLNVNDSQHKLLNLVGSDGFSLTDGRLSAADNEGSMVAWVQSREDRDGKVTCTKQRLVGSNPLCRQYNTAAAMERAIESYGGVQNENYIAPNYVDTQLGMLMDEPDEGNQTTNPGSNPSNPGSNPSTPSNPTPSGNIEISVAISPSADMGHVEGAGSYAEGEQVTLRAIPNSGYRFVWWQDNHDQNAQRVITVGNENASYTAVFGEII